MNDNSTTEKNIVLAICCFIVGFVVGYVFKIVEMYF